MKAQHYHGHRDRLRARFSQGGIEAMAEYELLEIILFAAIPRQDVKPLAKTLLTHFGGISALIHAPLTDICAVEGMTTNAAIILAAVGGLAVRGVQWDLSRGNVFSNWDLLVEYCLSTMAHEKREHFRILFLTRKNELLADEVQSTGSVDHTSAYPREIIRRALELGAAALVLVHNHPSGDPTPSDQDILLTRQIIQAATPFKIIVHDHLIVARGGYKSLKKEGLI